MCASHFTREVSAGHLYMTASMHTKSVTFLRSQYLLKIQHVQDKTDDIGVGIRSTALLFGDRTRPILSALSASSLSLVAYAGYMNAHGVPFYLGVSLAAAQLARIIHRTDYDQRQSCWNGFADCGWAGFWIWMGALADYSLLMLV
jgi:4-hydroxybenzoate polyprenyltransferase